MDLNGCGDEAADYSRVFIVACISHVMDSAKHLCRQQFIMSHQPGLSLLLKPPILSQSSAGRTTLSWAFGMCDMK